MLICSIVYQAGILLRLYIWPFDLKTTSVSCPVEDITWNTLHWTLAEAWPHDLVLYLHMACRTLLSLWDHESWPPILRGILPSSSILELQTTLHSLKNYKQLLNFGLFHGNTPGTSVWIWPRPLFGLICFQSILHSWQLCCVPTFLYLFEATLQPSTPHESKKHNILLLPITLSNVDRFSQFLTNSLSSECATHWALKILPHITKTVASIPCQTLRVPKLL